MDQILNQKIFLFLQVEHPTDDQIVEGATLMLRLAPGRYRSLYNSTLRRPKAYVEWVRRELQKHYAIRRRGLERHEVEDYNRETEELVSDTLSKIPEEIGVEVKETGAAPIIRGKRPDHDLLPLGIKALWDRNSERWKKMRELHAQLAALVAKPDYEPCDGNELCFQLRQVDNDIRNDYAIYDSYQTEEAASEDEELKDRADVVTDNMKVVQNCRTAITRNLKHEQPTEEQLQKVQEAVNTLVALKQTFKPETIERLKAVGISIPSEV